jgi:hypothetical protein
MTEQYQYKITYICAGLLPPKELSVIDFTDTKIKSANDVVRLYEKADKLVEAQLKKFEIKNLKIAHVITLWYRPVGGWEYWKIMPRN